MPAVFVHGVPETTAIWRQLLTHLSRRDVVTLSPPGFGAPVPDGFAATADAYFDWLVGELERLTRRYTASIIQTLGPDSDVPAPDVNTNEQIMAWFMDTYSMHQGYTVPGVVTGKPISLGGSEGRNEATARGAVFCIREAAGKIGLDLKGGVAFTLETVERAGDTDDKQMRHEKLTKAIDIISNRINAFGVAEPVIRQVGENRIEVQLPGPGP